MILHPGVLALVMGAVGVTTMMLYASLLGIKIVRKWNIYSSSPEQLRLERKTYLISTIMNYVIGFEILSALLFVYTVDDIHPIFIGAMCATGSLNANPVGWYVLYAKIATFFLGAIWIAVNLIDQRAEDYPLVRMKYGMLLAITPFIALDTYFSWKYFVDLKPNVITSCCGALFSPEGSGVASSLSTLPLRPMMILFYLSVGLFLVNAVAAVRWDRRLFRCLMGYFSVLVFVVAIASIIAFISLYFYEIPTHHCPFDILQREYHFIGYPLYICLFSGVLSGLLVGIFEPLKKIGSLNQIIGKAQQRWTMISMALIAIFAIICSWPIVFSSFTMAEYF
jgi:hypothetical protein